MGNCSVPQSSDHEAEHINRRHFNFQYVIGKGGFGKVWKVELRANKLMYAMKEMLKSRVISKRSVCSVMNEKRLLSRLKHPFLVNMQFAFQDRDNLYLVMDLMTGGDLRYHVGKMKRFSEYQTKFFVACIVTGLEYLHVNNVMHRDIKPENLVLDCRGYLRITDFGIARIVTADNYRDTSGTPGYMAPEVMCRQNHGIAIDYFALGVLAYEFMKGRRPYVGKTRKDIRDSILSKQVQLKRHEIPEGWSLESADFINKLLQRKPANRLGAKGPQEVKNHAWLKDFAWKKLLEKSFESPFKPSQEDNFDQRVNDDWKDEESLVSNDTAMQNLFEEYYFDYRKRGQQIEHIDNSDLLSSYN